MGTELLRNIWAKMKSLGGKLARKRSLQKKKEEKKNSEGNSPSLGWSATQSPFVHSPIVATVLALKRVQGKRYQRFIRQTISPYSEILSKAQIILVRLHSGEDHSSFDVFQLTDSMAIILERRGYSFLFQREHYLRLLIFGMEKMNIVQKCSFEDIISLKVSLELFSLTFLQRIVMFLSYFSLFIFL